MSAEKRGLPMPDNRHDWGRFIILAKAAGWVRRCGFGLDSYGSPKSLWKSAAC